MEELRSLVVCAQAGDLDAYGEIVRRFQDMAYGYAYSLLGDFHIAEDAAQEAFIEAYRRLESLRKPGAFPGWFRRIILGRCNRMSRRKRVPTVPLESAEGTASERPGPPEKAERREMADRVLDAVRTLPDNERTVTTLFYINGYSQKDIAEFLEVPVTTVNNRLHASRKRLKERMITMVAGELNASKPGLSFQEAVRKAIELQKRGQFADAVAAHQLAVRIGQERDVDATDLADSYGQLFRSYRAGGLAREFREGVRGYQFARLSDAGTIAKLRRLSLLGGALLEPASPERALHEADHMSDLTPGLHGQPAYHFWRGETLHLRWRAAVALEDSAGVERLWQEMLDNLDAAEKALAEACNELDPADDADDQERRQWHQQVGNAYHNLGVHIAYAQEGPQEKAEGLRLLRRSLELRDIPETHECISGLVLSVEGDRQATLEHLREAARRGQGCFTYYVEGRSKSLLDHPDFESVREDPEFVTVVRAGLASTE